MRPTDIALLALALAALAACGNASPDAPPRPKAAAVDAGASYADEESVEYPEGEAEAQPPRTAEPPPPPAPPAGAPAPAFTSPAERVLIRTGAVAFATRDLDSTHRHIAAAARSLDAFVAAERESRYGAARHLHLTLRVPAARFGELLARIGDGVEAYDERTVDTRDVTAEYVDLAARLRARRAIEERYVELVRRAADVEDVLAVERRLARVREEVEAAEGQLRYLRNRSELSTLEVHAYQPDAPAAGAEPAHPVVASLASGYSLLVALALGLLSAWPVALLAVAAGLFWRQRKRRSGAA